MADQSLSWGSMRGLLKTVRAAPACYTADQVMELDAAIRQDSFGFCRRSAMLLLTKPTAQLAADVKADRDLALGVTQIGLGIRKYIDCLQGLLHDLGNAELRALAAVSRRADRDELLREAQEQEQDHE